MQVPQFDYYYGSEAEQFTFYRLPKSLITDERFKGVSTEAKILYGILLDRMSLSIKNRWIDDCNRVYIIYTLEELMEDFSCSKRKAGYLLSELDTKGGIGLIEKKRQGLGKPNLLYIKNFLIKKDYSNYENELESQRLEEDVKKMEVDETRREVLSIQSGKNVQFKSGKNVQLKSGKNVQLKSGKILQPSKTNINKTNITKSINLSLPETRCLEISPMDMVDEILAYQELIKQNIEYDNLMQMLDSQSAKVLEEIVEVMVDAVAIKRETIKIGQTEYPYSLVKSRLLKLNSAHVSYVLSCFKKNVTKVHNIKSYLLASLYNAPSTIKSYYMAEVQHDMYAGRI